MSETLERGFNVKTLFGSTIKVKKFLAEGGQGSSNRMLCAEPQVPSSFGL